VAFINVSVGRALPGRPVLISVGGLPATGKTTVARTLAAELRAAYLRIDSIETAISRAEGQFVQTNGWDLPPGYLVGYDVAADQLRNGLDVVAESVNPLPASRDAWRDAGIRAGARVIEVEVVAPTSTSIAAVPRRAFSTSPDSRSRPGTRSPGANTPCGSETVSSSTPPSSTWTSPHS